jgi:hypothetical protein
MSYQLVDTFTEKVLGTYGTEADAQKAETHLIHEPGESRYKIVGPPAPKKVSKKQANVKEKGN